MTATANGFDPDLIRRYDVNGPRYTSYPTANLFSEAFDVGELRAALAAGPPRPDRPRPLSLYLHVPFCAHVCYYCACNKIITNNRRHAVAYLERLHREIAMVAELLPAAHRVEQLHFGGGTPTYLTDEQFQALFAVLDRHFHLAAPEDREFSIEIDPRTVDPERMGRLMDLGFNRVSLGIQDFDPDVQKAVNRVQSVDDTRAIIAAARARGVKSVSVDLIYGLPLQTPASFARTLASIVDLAPDRISLYSYAHLPQRFKTQRQIDVLDLPRADAKLQLLELAIDTLCGAGPGGTQGGYEYVGMDHFARRDDSLVRARQEGRLQRNFQGYATHSHCDLVGLGVSAISTVGGVFAQNCKDLPGYYEKIDSGSLATERGLVSSAEDGLRREVIAALMCDFRVDLDAVSARHGTTAQHFAAELDALAPMAADGLVTLDGAVIEVTSRGRFLIRNVAMVFDAYLAPATQGFSRAI